MVEVTGAPLRLALLAGDDSVAASPTAEECLASWEGTLATTVECHNGRIEGALEEDECDEMFKVAR